MVNRIYRLYVEKNTNYNVEGEELLKDIRINLGISNLQGLRLVNRYDIMGISENQYLKSRNTIFSEPTVDKIYDEELDSCMGDTIFAIEYLPGQYDQRADSAAQCIQILTENEKPVVKTARVIILKGDISESELNKIKEYCINTVDSREASLLKQENLQQEFKEVE